MRFWEEILPTYWLGRLWWLLASRGSLWRASASYCHLWWPRRWFSKRCQSSRCSRGSNPLRCHPGPQSHCRSQRCDEIIHQPCLYWHCREGDNRGDLFQHFVLSTPVSDLQRHSDKVSRENHFFKWSLWKVFDSNLKIFFSDKSDQKIFLFGMSKSRATAFFNLEISGTYSLWSTAIFLTSCLLVKTSQANDPAGDRRGEVLMFRRVY